MTYKLGNFQWYNQTKTIVTERIHLIDEFGLTFNPSEFVFVRWGADDIEFRRAGIINDSFGNVIHWTYGNVQLDGSPKILVVFNGEHFLTNMES